LLLAVVAGGVFRPEGPRLSRNGAIAFAVVDLPTRPYNHGHLIEADGSNDRVIGQATCPTFSRNGTALSYMSGWADTAELVVARPDGSEARVLPGVGESNYALSPDGTKVAWFKSLRLITTERPDGSGSTVGAKNELWVTPVSGGPGVRIVGESDAPTEWFSHPVWSPDGRQIAFAANVTVFSADQAGAYRSAIHIVDADSSSLHAVSARPGTDAIGLSWSPDGQFVAYLGLPDGSPLPSLGVGSGPPISFWLPLDVFVVGVDGSGDTNLTNSRAYDLAPSWSPDGAYLAYLTEASQPGFRLATIPMNGRVAAGPPYLGPESSNISSVVWSPDGEKLLWLQLAVSDPSTGPQTVHSSIGSVDARFRQPSFTVVTVDFNIMCSPSWQRREP
jgi:Tol biopolymer transport system component